jgi:hypothetical protein
VGEYNCVRKIAWSDCAELLNLLPMKQLMFVLGELIGNYVAHSTVIGDNLVLLEMGCLRKIKEVGSMS